MDFSFLSDRDRIRTCDRLLRRQMLYPAELRDLLTWSLQLVHRSFSEGERYPAKYANILRGKYTNVLFTIKLITTNILRIHNVWSIWLALSLWQKELLYPRYSYSAGFHISTRNNFI